MRLMILLLLLAVSTLANEGGYRQPPEPIASMLDAPRRPWLLPSPDGRMALEVRGRDLPGIDEVAAPTVDLAGLRLLPSTNGRADEWYSRELQLVDLETLARRPVPLPPDPMLNNLRWSPDGRHLSFCNTTATGIELWLHDCGSGESRRLLEGLNAALGDPFAWRPSGEALVCLRVPPGRGPVPEEGPPTSPLVEENRGRVAASRTWQNLIRSEHDAALFEHYGRSEPVEVALDGSVRPLAAGAMYTDFSLSPDDRWLLLETVQPPWSRSLPMWRFAQRTSVVELATGQQRTIAELPLAEEVPIAFGSVRTGPRRIGWRADLPATLAWTEALDGGDAGAEAELRDALLLLEAPFDGSPRELARLQWRHYGTIWGRADLALVYEGWHKSRRMRAWFLDPSSGEMRLWHERDSEDAYADRGSPETTREPHRRLLFSPDGAHLWLTGNGASEDGVHPFLDRLEIASGRSERVWRSRDPDYERVQELLAADGSRLLIARESRETPDHLVLLDKPKRRKLPLRSSDHRQRRATEPFDPAPQLAGLQQELIRYPRSDGMELSGTLYLPPGYDAERDGPLPTLLWVYPQEFRSSAAASRVTTSENLFSRPSGTSTLFLLTQGYAVLANPSMPILGEGDERPNDRYLEQLIASAEAAVDELERRGVAQRGRLAIGGHSYGAFTAANLLAHSDLFRTAICRSGAYNRTLTPFGFQGEDRSFWEAPATYLEMSPFIHADRINESLLLIHGMDDDNPGTYPMQSERFFEALKGLGATVRFVQLPGEGHGYRARESVGHVLWEMCDWLERELKAP
jgi:dipeptidyl aminopeptidase/acylaminoacyl peptidase